MVGEGDGAGFTPSGVAGGDDVDKGAGRVVGFGIITVGLPVSLELATLYSGHRAWCYHPVL